MLSKFINKNNSSIYSLSIIIFFFCTIFIVSLKGKNSRIFTSKIVSIGQNVPEIIVVEKQRQVYNIWKERGLHGRVVLHFDTAMDIKPLSGLNMDILHGRYPDMLSAISTGDILNDENFMLFAIADDIVRELNGIVSKKSYSAIEKELRDAKYADYGEYYRGVILGVPKIVIILKKITSFNEPVLMDFDAKFFADPEVDPDELYNRLKRLGIKTDLVTFSLPEGEAEVTASKMNKFINLLRNR